jgi:hypothetical protein
MTYTLNPAVSMKIKMGIKEQYKNSDILFELSTDLAEICLIETEPESEMFNRFVLIWGDYVANLFEETYELLSTATARMATLLHILEREPEGEVIGLSDSAGWSRQWENIAKEHTKMMSV